MDNEDNEDAQRTDEDLYDELLFAKTSTKS
jgi:hypothetical protein